MSAIIIEIIQALVALGLIAPTMYIGVFQATHNQPIQIPDFFAALVATVVTFYFGKVVVSNGISNGITKAITTFQSSSPTVETTPAELANTPAK